MIILTIRTDKPKAELALYDDNKKIVERTWLAHRQLAETIHATIDELVQQAGYTMKDVQGIGCFKGPGSFTGLRIGLTVANALAGIYEMPIVSAYGSDWNEKVIQRLQNGENEVIAMPEYGAPATTTTPKK